MSLRRLIVEVDPATLNVAEFCRQHGVSTWLFWDLRRRFARLGEAALEPASRAPLRVANRTPGWMEDLVVAERKRLSDLGLDSGPSSIGCYLRVAHGRAVPSDSGIWRILKRRGFINPDPAKAPKRAGRRFQAERANECWQIDDTGWQLADASEVKIINIVDDRSRVLTDCRAVRSCSAEAAFAAFSAGAARWGWPARFLSDNANAFRQGLAAAVAVMGIAAGHSRPYHPQTCGKVERFHQTLKRYLAAQDPAGSLEELQAQLDWFRQHYNHHRPHRSLNRQTPARTWHDSPKSGPANQPLGAPTTIHHTRVGANGGLPVGPYSISVGAAYTSRTLTTVITGAHAHVFDGTRLIRTLTINPTRRVQPIYSRPGRPRPLP